MRGQVTAAAFGDSAQAAGNVADQASDATESALDSGNKSGAAVSTQDKPKVRLLAAHLVCGGAPMGLCAAARVRRT